MKKSYWSVISILLLAGCADPQARKLAVHVDQDIVTYESAVDAKVNAENKFYQDQLTTIRQALGGNSAITIGNTNAAATNLSVMDPERIKRTLPYGRITTRALRDGRIEAEKLISSDKAPLVMTDIMEYVTTGVNEEQTDFLDLLQRQRQLASSFKSSLAAIDQQKQKMAAVRKSLATLAAVPSASAQLQVLFAFGQGVRSQLTNSISTPVAGTGTNTVLGQPKP